MRLQYHRHLDFLLWVLCKATYRNSGLSDEVREFRYFAALDGTDMKTCCATFSQLLDCVNKEVKALVSPWLKKNKKKTPQLSFSLFCDAPQPTQSQASSDRQAITWVQTDVSSLSVILLLFSTTFSRKRKWSALFIVRIKEVFLAFHP